MTALDVIRSLEALDAVEMTKVRVWLDAHGEPPELLEAVDAGLRSLDEGLSRDTSRAALSEKVAGWAGGSR